MMSVSFTHFFCRSKSTNDILPSKTILQMEYYPIEKQEFSLPMLNLNLIKLTDRMLNYVANVSFVEDRLEKFSNILHLTFLDGGRNCVERFAPQSSKQH